MLGLVKTKNRTLPNQLHMADIKTLLENYKTTYFAELDAVKTEHELETFRVAHISRQGSLSLLMHELKSLSLEEKKTLGPSLMN